ncbi:MAG: DUF3054 domain-containing protein [Chloroflexia bacterium]|nr:DUF3054 domain-containing protein [Chloroflexia bacterium]
MMRVQLRARSQGSVGLLALGDVLALMAFLVVGLANHDRTSDLLTEGARIGVPFVIGWFAAAIALDAFAPQQGRRALMLRSTLAWAVGIAIALVLRNTVFGSQFSLVFAVIAYVFTGLFLLGWRGVYAFLLARS